MMKKFRYPIIILMVVLDQLVKYIVRSNMEVGESIDVLGSFFSLRYIQNTGAAFSIMEGNGVFLIAITVIAMIALVLYMEVYKNGTTLFLLSITMLIGGGIGNLIDRVFLKFVTDMFDFHFWPVFNVADIFVVLGCVLLVIDILKADQDKVEKKRPTLND